MWIKLNRIIILLFIALILFSCATASHETAVAPIKDAKVTENLPENFASNKIQNFDNISVDDGWIKSFHDPTLEKLVDEAMNNNPGLKIADAQVDKARALAGLAESGLKPTIGVGGEYDTGKLYDGNNDYAKENGYAGATISWELDVWGKVRNAAKAGQEQYEATVADFEFAKQSLAASVAVAWFMVTEAKLQHQLAKDILMLRKESLRIVKVRDQIGQGNERDVHLAKASLAASEQIMNQTLAAYERAQRGLEVILGRYPSADLEAADRIVALPPKIPVGIPSSVLERRPDLIAAERRVAAAFYQKESAELMKLPSFSITAGGGVNNIGDVIAGLSAGVFAPLYTGGAIESQIDQATADQKATIAQYAKVALTAFQEVENTLASEDNLKLQLDSVRLQSIESREAYEQTKKQYELGQITYLDVINVQNKWINSRIVEIDIETKRLTNRVNLHLALGGSFEEK